MEALLGFDSGNGCTTFEYSKNHWIVQVKRVKCTLCELQLQKRLCCLFVCFFKIRMHSSCCWRRQWHPTPVLLPGKSCGWRSLVGCSPWGHWESDTTERLHFHFSLSYTGVGNGNPLQCSRLENPRDGGAWWAAVYGVAQSRTRLKWLSSSSRHLIHMANEWMNEWHPK